MGEETVPEPVDPWWVDVGDRRLWLSFLAVTMNLVPQLDAHHKRLFGITHVEYTVLIVLAESADREVRLSTLARQTHVSLSRLSHIVRRLEADGRLRLSRSSTDARATVATLTPEGVELVDRAAPENMAEVRRLLFEPLSSEQREQLTDISMTLMRAWKPDEAQPWLPWKG